MQPIVEEISPKMSTLQIYEVFRNEPYSYLLDSGLKHENLGRYSFAGGDPFLIFSARGNNCVSRYPGKYTYYMRENPFDCLQKLIGRYSNSFAPGLPMASGGAVGYFAYDTGRCLEKIPRCTVDDLGLPECIMPFYDRGVILDHMEDKAYLFSTGFPFTGKEGVARRDERYRDLCRRFRDAREESNGHVQEFDIKGRDLRSNFSKEKYLTVVEKALHYIGQGDIYQVNMTQRFEARLDSPPWDLYRRLRSLNPAPFASFLNFPEVTVVSSSPERFLRQEGSFIETRPIKGTRRRGSTKEEDRALRRELLESGKDKAELVMIVDLERNDLSRVCATGTVDVPELFTLEEYATVYHLVSTVTGSLPPEKDIIDVLKASFPGGSITGAPKIRSMEIIEELEPVRRGIYTGSIGYIDFSGQADLNIVIRTIIVKGNRVYFQVGGGIVADSSPEAEYQETLDKAKALLGALGFSTQGVSSA